MGKMLLVATLFALIIHEAGHALAVILTRAGKVQGLVFHLKGIGLKWEPYSHDPIKRSVVSLSGSAVNLGLATLFIIAGFEILALANLVFGVVNLLPLPGSDGLRAYGSIKGTT